MSFLVRHRYVVLLVVAAFVLDQVTKLVVIQTVPFRTSWPAEGFFRITHVGNTGSAFGLLDGQNLGLIVASVIGIAILVLFYRSHPSPGRLVRASLALMLAGALGNLTDRLINGHVTDFVDIGPWYIFNVADASIVVGVIVLSATMLLAKHEATPKVDEATEESAVGPGPDAAAAVETPPTTPPP